MQDRHFVIGQKKVWFGILPTTYDYVPNEWLEHAITGVERKLFEPRASSYKFWVHNHSGILGVRFIPKDSQELLVRVGIYNFSDDNHIVVSGLSQQFADVVLNEAITRAKDTAFLGSGVLQFDHAGYDRLESGTGVFRVLTRTVIQLLDPALDTASEADVAARVRKIV